MRWCQEFLFANYDRQCEPIRAKPAGPLIGKEGRIKNGMLDCERGFAQPPITNYIAHVALEHWE